MSDSPYEVKPLTVSTVRPYANKTDAIPDIWDLQDAGAAGSDGYFLTFCRSPERQQAIRRGRQVYVENDAAGADEWIRNRIPPELSAEAPSPESTPLAPLDNAAVHDPGDLVSPQSTDPEMAEASSYNLRDSIRDQAEQLLIHCLRCPNLCATACQQLNGLDFGRATRKDLGHVWEVVQGLVREHGPDVLRDQETWRYRLETAVRQACQTRGGMVSTGVPALLAADEFSGQPSFFDRAFSCDTVQEGAGQVLLQQFLFFARFVDPLQKLASDSRLHEEDPSRTLARVRKLLEKAADVGGTSKPLFLTPEEFAKAEFPLEWLIPGVLVKRQPCIVGGPSKGMKTSLMIDLAVSLGVGGPTCFLNQFSVGKPGKRVGFISGESGGATIKETFLRVCKAKGVELPQSNVYPEFKLPKLSKAQELATLVRSVQQHQLEVLIIDPIYLSLLAGNPKLSAANLFDVGPLLSDVSQACQEAGATLILVHHTTKRLPGPNFAGQFEPIDREDLAMAGFAEFARQWLLVNRREKYEDGTGEHRLWLRLGGSAGFGSLWAVDIDEGLVQDDFRGRRWHVQVRSTKAIQEVDAQKREQAKAQKQLDQEQEFKKRLYDALGQFPDGETATALRNAADISRTHRIGHLLDQLVQERRAEPVLVKKPAGRGFHDQPGYKLKWENPIPDPSPVLSPQQ